MEFEGDGRVKKREPVSTPFSTSTVMK